MKMMMNAYWSLSSVVRVYNIQYLYMGLFLRYYHMMPPNTCRLVTSKSIPSTALTYVECNMSNLITNWYELPS